MVSEYSYKTPVSKDMAIAELIQHKGTQFDADMVEVFVKII
jgi:response regulator RpfG family c-di-GMP phosphodiesterase